MCAIHKVKDLGVPDISAGNKTLLDFARLVKSGRFNAFSGKLKTGVDLGTANIVLAVVDEQNRPVAGMTHPSVVVRDGIVMDYVGAVRAVRQLKAELESLLGTTLDTAAAAIPPGIIEGNVKAIGNVVEAADFTLSTIIDEPTAASTVLGIQDGAVVDVGGGTTGISILENGKVVFTGDEATGGTHMTLVLAGFERISTEEAEKKKKDTAQEQDVFPIIKPVVEKMASIVQRYITGYDVRTIYVVGGASAFTDFESTFEKIIGIPVVKPAVPLLVTPLGIAMNCEL